MYPSSLSVFRTTYDNATFERPFRSFPGEDHAIIALARDTFADVLLPAAFFRLSQHNIGYILWYNRCEMDDTDAHETDDTDYLTLDEIICCLRGCEKFTLSIRNAFLKAAIDIGRSRVPICECAQYQRAEAFVDMMKIMSHLPFISQGSFSMSPFFESVPVTMLCENCRSFFMSEVDHYLQKTWDNLPCIFGLQSREALESND